MKKIKVTMNLFEKDVNNTSFIVEALQAQSKAHAVSIALSLTKFIVEETMNGAQLVLRQKNGDYERVRMTELEGLYKEESTGRHRHGTEEFA